MNTKQQCDKYVMSTYARQDLELVSGKGATCYDENQKQYIDFGSGIGVNSLGFCDDDWCNAVSKQASTLQHTSNLYYTSPMAKLAQRICTHTGYANMFFANSGAEANEGAIKLARKYSFDKYGADAQRNKIITLQNSFHGRTVTTLSATGQDVFHNFFYPFTQGFDYAVANDIEELKSKLNDKCCAVMLEFIQGEGGVIPLDHEYVQNLFTLCGEKDILIIADEVQTGIGRTGKLLASECYSVQPDITTLAKGLGGGLPIGAILATDKVSNVLTAGHHATTFGGNPVVCAGANIVLDKLLHTGVLDEITKKGEYIKSELLKLDEIEVVDGIGLMLGLRLKSKNAAQLVKDCIKNGLIVLTAKEKLRLLPPLTISYDEINAGLAILKQALSE